MNWSNLTSTTVRVALIAAVACTMPLTTSVTHAATARPTMPGVSNASVPDTLRPALYAALAQDTAATYHLDNHGCAVLSRQSLSGCFDSQGAHFDGAQAPSLSLHFAAFGRGDQLTTVPSVRPTIHANVATYTHDAITEWWRVLPIGFEQGFTIAKRPAGTGQLRVALTASHVANTHGDGLTWGALRYDGLVVTDANGKPVAATFKTKSDRVLIAVADANAAYPLTIDPLVWTEQKVTGSGGAGGDSFGVAVAVSGDTALIGASNGQFPGVAYVFTRSAGSWSETQKITANNGTAGDNFGYSVALSGTTAIIGAPYANIGGRVGQGAAYVFNEADGSWNQTAKLTASDGSQKQKFGYSVALSGTDVLVGSVGAIDVRTAPIGAVYTYAADGGTWHQVQKFMASDGAAGDGFGWAIAADSTTAIISAPYATVNGTAIQGAAYVFSRVNGTWTQDQKLTASDGAEGDFFGVSSALDKTTLLIGAPYADIGTHANQGAAYVFNQSAGSWNQTQKLVVSDGAAIDQFGQSVAVLGDTALVGAYFVNVNETSLAGAAYVFKLSDNSWSESLKVSANEATQTALFGRAVALNGSTALIGAPGATVNGNAHQGAAYFYASGAQAIPMYVNGTLSSGPVTDSGVAAPTGTNWSELQHLADYDTIGNSLVGLTGAASPYGTSRLADDFTVPGGETWTLDGVVLFSFKIAYSGATSPFSTYTLRIWNGRPGDPGSTVICGDTTTNVLMGSSDAKLYRIPSTVVPPLMTPNLSSRVWKNVLSLPTDCAGVFPSGTYWLDWNSSTATPNPPHYDPTRVVVGARGLPGDNAMRWNSSTDTWDPVIDLGKPLNTAADMPQDFPFQLLGTIDSDVIFRNGFDGMP